MKKGFEEVVEIVECNSIEEANRYLERKKNKSQWILVDTFVSKMLCFKKVEVPSSNGVGTFTKIQPVDQIVKMFILGRLK